MVNHTFLFIRILSLASLNMASVFALQGPPNGKHDLEKSDKSDKVSDRDRPLDEFQAVILVVLTCTHNHHIIILVLIHVQLVS